MRYKSILAIIFASLLSTSHAAPVIFLDTDHGFPDLRIFLNKLIGGITYEVVCTTTTDLGDRVLAQVSLNYSTNNYDSHYFLNGQRVRYYTVVGLETGTVLKFSKVTRSNDVINITNVARRSGIQANCIAEPIHR